MAYYRCGKGHDLFPWFRLIRVGLGCIAVPKVDLLATTRVRLRAWPNDLDLNLHVNNGRYLALADIGRIDWFVRTGVLGLARTQRAFPVIGDAIAKFRHDLRVFQAFEIHTLDRMGPQVGIPGTPLRARGSGDRRGWNSRCLQRTGRSGRSSGVLVGTCPRGAIAGIAGMGESFSSGQRAVERLVTR